jgi:lysophospholipase L1-like esterase
VNEIIRDVAASFGIPLVDNNLYIHKHIKKEEREKYLIPDGHPNARGYRVITDNILKVLTESDLLKIR